MQSIPKLGPEMDNSKFCGVIPPVIIPLHEDRSLDKEAFEFSINRMIDAGVNGLFFLGSSGEVAFLTDEERMRRSVSLTAGFLSWWALSTSRRCA